MDIVLSCENIEVRSNGYREISVTLSEINKEEILDYFDVSDVTNYFKHNDILDEIGKDSVMKYFSLIEPE